MRLPGRLPPPVEKVGLGTMGLSMGSLAAPTATCSAIARRGNRHATVNTDNFLGRATPQGRWAKRFSPRQRQGAYTTNAGVPKTPSSISWFKNTSRTSWPKSSLRLDVVLQLKSPYHDGTTHIVMSPLGVHAAPGRACPPSKAASHPLPWRPRAPCQAAYPRSFHPQGTEQTSHILVLTIPVPDIPHAACRRYGQRR